MTPVPDPFPSHTTPSFVRRIFDDYVSEGNSIRKIAQRLYADDIPTPRGRHGVWGVSTLCRLLRNEAYVGRVYFNPTETVPDPRSTRKTKQVPPTTRGKDSHRRARPHPRAGLPRRRNGQPGQQPVEPTPGRARPLAAARSGQVRHMRGRHELPQDARPQRPPGTATTAETMTSSAQAGPNTAAPNATSAPMPSTRSSSTKSDGEHAVDRGTIQSTV
jgi:Recombinase